MAAYGYDNSSPYFYSVQKSASPRFLVLDLDSVLWDDQREANSTEQSLAWLQGAGFSFV